MRVCTLLCFATILVSQTPAKRTFEVASVKPSNSKADGVIYTNDPRRIVFRNIPLPDLIVAACRMNGERIEGIPESLKNARYDIEAVASDPDEGRPPGTMRHRAEMEALLEERFHLRRHLESRVLSVYELVRGDGPVKLKPSEGTGRPRIDSAPGRVTFVHYWLNMFLAQVYTRLGREKLVIDNTGIDGPFDITVEYSPDGDDGASTPPLEAFYRTIDQMGLKLRAAKHSIEFLIIDHIEAPSPN